MILVSVLIAVLAGGAVLALLLERWDRKPRAPPTQDAPAAPARGPVELAGDVRLSGALALPEGLLVRGALTLAPGASVAGEVRAEGDVRLLEEARIEGTLTGLGNLALGRGALVGPTALKGDAVLAEGARVEGALVCDRLLFLVPPAEETPVPLLPVAALALGPPETEMETETPAAQA